MRKPRIRKRSCEVKRSHPGMTDANNGEIFDHLFGSTSSVHSPSPGSPTSTTPISTTAGNNVFMSPVTARPDDVGVVSATSTKSIPATPNLYPFAPGRNLFPANDVLSLCIGISDSKSHSSPLR